MAVGMALAESMMAAHFNTDDYKVVDHYTYALVGEGCLMEGVSSEASSFAGTNKLGKLIVFYDENYITIDGSTNLAFTEDIAKRYDAYGWQVLRGSMYDMEDIAKLVAEAKKDTERPTLIMLSYLISKIKVEKIMSKNVVSVQENEVVEEAARIMEDSDIGCLPVLKGDLLVGIITESDLFREFVDMFGTRYKGVRITAILNEKPGQLATFTAFIAEAGGNIVSLVTSEADDLTKRCCTCKVTGLSKDAVEEAFKKTGAEITDVRVI